MPAMPISRVVLYEHGVGYFEPEARVTGYRLRVRKTTYTFNNRSNVEHILYLDHLREDDWKLVETSEPQSIAENHWRFRIMLAAKKATSFVVREQVTVHHFEIFNDLNANQLSRRLRRSLPNNILSFASTMTGPLASGTG